MAWGFDPLRSASAQQQAGGASNQTVDGVAASGAWAVTAAALLAGAVSLSGSAPQAQASVQTASVQALVTVAGQAAGLAHATDVATVLPGVVTLTGQEPSASWSVIAAAMEAGHPYPVHLFRHYQRVRRHAYVRM